VKKITIFFFKTIFYTNWMVKSVGMKWVGRAAHVGDRRDAYRFSVGRHERKSHLEDLVVDWMVILKLIFKKWDGGAWTGLICLRRGTGAWRF
jgi:hypothetical protein